MAPEVLLVSPQLVLYRLAWKDEAALQRIAARHHLSSQLLHRLREVLGWRLPPPGRARATLADNWQLLEDVRWFKRAEHEALVPLVGDGKHRHELFNQLTGCEYPWNATFEKFLKGSRRLDGVWERTTCPAAMRQLASGNSLVGCFQQQPALQVRRVPAPSPSRPFEPLRCSPRRRQPAQAEPESPPPNAQQTR